MKVDTKKHDIFIYVNQAFSNASFTRRSVKHIINEVRKLNA